MTVKKPEMSEEVQVVDAGRLVQIPGSGERHTSVLSALAEVFRPQRGQLQGSADGKCTAMVLGKAQDHRERTISSNVICVAPEIKKK